MSVMNRRESGGCRELLARHFAADKRRAKRLKTAAEQVGDERACSRATATEGQRESWCNCVIAASVFSPELWRRRDAGTQGGRDESGDRGEEREKEFRDRLIYEFLFLNRDVFRDFAKMSQSGADTHTHTHTHTTQQLVILLAKSVK